MRARLTVVAGLALALAAGACTRHDYPAATPGEPAPQGPSYSVQVTNHMTMAMNIAYTIGDAVTALGQLQPGQTATYTIPNRGGDDIQIVANAPGSTDAIRKSLDLKAGGTITVDLK